MSMEELVKKYEGAYGSDFEAVEEESTITSDDETENYEGSDNGLYMLMLGLVNLI